MTRVYCASYTTFAFRSFSKTLSSIFHFFCNCMKHCRQQLHTVALGSEEDFLQHTFRNAGHPFRHWIDSIFTYKNCVRHKSVLRDSWEGAFNPAGTLSRKVCLGDLIILFFCTFCTVITVFTQNPSVVPTFRFSFF
jgi:hypothetical protein